MRRSSTSDLQLAQKGVGNTAVLADQQALESEIGFAVDIDADGIAGVEGIAIILRKVTELALNPGMNIQDGFLTSHLERTFFKAESDLLREFLGASSDIIESPSEAQKLLFGPTRRRVPALMDLENPMLLGPVQNQEHYMNGVIAHRNNFAEPILGFLQDAYDEFAELTGRHYGLVSEYKNDDAEVAFVSLGSAAENIEAAVDYLREEDNASVGSVHLNVLRPFPTEAVVKALNITA